MPRPVPEDYVCRVKKPADFHEFWDEVLAQAARIPLNPDPIPDPLRTSEDVEVFQVFYDSLDNVRIASWYCVPTNRAGAVPAMLILPGYQSDPAIPK